MNKRKNIISPLIFGITLFLFQFLGYNVISLGLLALSSLALISASSITGIKANKFYVAFLVLSITISSFHLIGGIPSSRSLQVWGQFFFFSILFLFVKDKPYLLMVVSTFIYIIFVMDVFTNLLLFVGFDIPWVQLPNARPGETLPRYPGIKGNQLFSGSISYSALCFFIHDRKWKVSSLLFLVLILFNLFLGGSNRYFVLVFVLGLLYVFKLYKKKTLLVLLYFSTIFIVFFSAINEVSKTGDLDSSNAKRTYLWGITINKIAANPLEGIGMFSPTLEDDLIATAENMEDAGVTESTILLICLCFGIPCAILFFSMLVKTLSAFSVYDHYCPELGLFIGYSLDLFWGGSLENSISLCVFLLSMYIINDNNLKDANRRKSVVLCNNTDI